MDDDTRQAFASLSSMLTDIDAGVRGTRAELHEVRREVHSVHGKVMALSGRTEVLEKHVFGSNPPPTPPNVPLLTRTTGAEHDVDALQGQLIAVESRLATVEITSAEAKAAAEETKAINEKQSRVMGIPTEREPSTMQTIVAFVKSREGRKLLVSLVTLALAAAGAKAASSTAEKVERAPVVAPASSGGR